MTTPPPFQRLTIARCGAIAREVLSDDGEVRVLAVFERTFYLACPHGIVCVGPPDLIAGPINVATADERTWTSLALAVDDEGAIAAGMATVGDTLAIDVASGTTWHPPPFPDFVASSASRGVTAIRDAVAAECPSDGLASLVFSPAVRRASSGIDAASAAAQPVAQLRDTLPGVLRSGRWNAAALRAATLLIGLGPGFTPSGDDLVGGLMLALTAAGRAPLRNDLWHALRPELDDLTTPPSAMHLSAAADGMAAEPIHHLLDEILSGGTPALGDRLAAVTRLGHTSGWDIAAGTILGLEAVLDTGP
jgi:hypothetical protein